MSTDKPLCVAGVDGCKAGWCAAVARPIDAANRQDANCVLELKRFFVARTFAEVLAETSDCELVCVDIPIGLTDGKSPRKCDLEARKILRGPRASSVFPAPVRPCLTADDYEAASRISLERSGKKLSRQSFAILPKIREVDDLMTRQLQSRVREIHPEVSFCALNSNELVDHNKRTVPGQAKRRKLLQTALISIDDVLADAPSRGYNMDDALDAIVAAWTAAQTVLGKAGTLPDSPGRDSKGLKMEILCPRLL
ncbi:MAG: DUF429 domain-containing protein [Planctomycetota bacterium]|jgi:predicted RNase H-like nuclease